MAPTELNQIRNAVRQKRPLVHSITNPISINQCANTVLALGARPMMAEHPKEVSSITKSADSLLLNLGNITDIRKKSIIISAQTAKKNDIPFCLDAVGVACSPFRRKFALRLIKKYTPSIIKGNYSEINALFNESYSSRGIDADLTLAQDIIADASKELAKHYGCVVLASGKTDIVTDGKEIFYVSNGTENLASVTGTGCMLGVMCATFLSSANSLLASVCACASLGICGELASFTTGTGSFMISLLDNISTLSDESFIKHLALEKK